MWSESEWKRAVNCVAEQILSRAGYSGGGIDGLVLARQLGFDVFYDRQQSARGRLKQFGKRRSIFVKPEQRSERVHWAICHELGEGFAHHVFHHLGATGGDLPQGMREQIANCLASRLLLPEQEFFLVARSVRESLVALKKAFPHASYEMIANRLLDQDQPRCITIVDQGRISRRRANWNTCGKQFFPVENDCWEQVHREGTDREFSDERWSCRGWAVHEPHWKREIMVTHPHADVGMSESV